MNSEKLKYVAGIVVGVVTVFASLWAGSFLLHRLGPGHWAACPTFVTSMIVFFCGVGLTLRSDRALDGLGD